MPNDGHDLPRSCSNAQGDNHATTLLFISPFLLFNHFDHPTFLLFFSPGFIFVGKF